MESKRSIWLVAVALAGLTVPAAMAQGGHPPDPNVTVAQGGHPPDPNVMVTQGGHPPDPNAAVA